MSASFLKNRLMFICTAFKGSLLFLESWAPGANAGPGVRGRVQILMEQQAPSFWAPRSLGYNFPGYKLPAGEHQIPKSSGPGAGGEVALFYPEALV